MISSSITVTRDDTEIEVFIHGHTEHFRSPNPYECGERLVDWGIDEPKGFKLTKSEQQEAEYALEACI